jgi:hypothetical protein
MMFLVYNYIRQMRYDATLDMYLAELHESFHNPVDEHLHTLQLKERENYLHVSMYVA